MVVDSVRGHAQMVALAGRYPTIQSLKGDYLFHVDFHVAIYGQQSLISAINKKQFLKVFAVGFHSASANHLTSISPKCSCTGKQPVMLPFIEF